MNSTRGIIVQELCEYRGGRPGLSVLTSLLVSVDVKLYWTMLRHWSQLVLICQPTSEYIKKHNRTEPEVHPEVRPPEVHTEDVLLVEFMYLVFTRMPGESYRRRLRSLLLYLCYLFRVLIYSLVCCFQTMTGIPRFLLFRCMHARYAESVFIRLATCTCSLREETCFVMWIRLRTLCHDRSALRANETERHAVKERNIFHASHQQYKWKILVWRIDYTQRTMSLPFTHISWTS